jgi:hypothetical protein
MSESTRPATASEQCEDSARRLAEHDLREMGIQGQRMDEAFERIFKLTAWKGRRLSREERAAFCQRLLAEYTAAGIPSIPRGPFAITTRLSVPRAWKRGEEDPGSLLTWGGVSQLVVAGERRIRIIEQEIPLCLTVHAAGRYARRAKTAPRAALFPGALFRAAAFGVVVYHLVRENPGTLQCSDGHFAVPQGGGLYLGYVGMLPDIPMGIETWYTASEHETSQRLQPALLRAQEEGKEALMLTMELRTWISQRLLRPDQQDLVAAEEVAAPHLEELGEALWLRADPDDASAQATQRRAGIAAGRILRGPYSEYVRRYEGRRIAMAAKETRRNETRRNDTENQDGSQQKDPAQVIDDDEEVIEEKSAI